MRGRFSVAASLVAAVLLLPVVGAQADPKPTLAEAQAKLKKLNKQMDDIVDEYNAANEKWKKSKKQYDQVNSTYKVQDKKVQALRAGVIGVAVTNYQTGDFRTLSGLFSNDNPEAALSGIALMDQLAAGRSLRLSEFETAIKDLKTQRESKKKTFDDATVVKDDLVKQKKKADRMVAEQVKLLRELGAYNPGNTNSAGQVYTGSASGNARAALEFAYAQIGKPYRYGGTGPGSWDCSGLVQASWAKGGVSLPRTSYEMWAWGASRRVSVSALEPGDLVWHSGFGHVGLYAGNGKVVHSPQTGDVVKEVSLSEYNPDKAVRP
ncbi:C40 family peptidase [Acrocarpospora catenulata]|uniref:C40 family peptidase n=1 Tax=Acrocarpospora catenulata TaxID=2836182 RepID=UPI001BD91CA2|nr:C40 family peptidase [Acrocarpospora catenulata]